jgi:HEPN domain-containing protein
VSSPEGDLDATSRILARKAEEDATAVREFAGNLEISDSIIGFHAQQAVEKWLKALTAARGIRHKPIHDIDLLIELLEKADVEMPLDRDRLAGLTQYAVPMRYDELLDAESLDRAATVGLVDEVGEWATGLLSPSSS